MTDQKGHPVPSQELKQQWWEKAEKEHEDYWYEHAADSAAAWGADQELEACCEWVERNIGMGREWGEELRAARRPKPLSLKEQALAQLVALEQHRALAANTDTIRRALEALDD